MPMIEPDSLEDLPLLKHHATPGEVRRDSLDAYMDLGEVVREDVEQAERRVEVYADGQ